MTYITEIKNQIKSNTRIFIPKNKKGEYDLKVLNKLILTKITGISFVENSKYNNAVKSLMEKFPKTKKRTIYLYAQLVVTKGKNTTLKDVHDAWAISEESFNPEDKLIVPFSELSEENKDKYKPLLEVILELS